MPNFGDVQWGAIAAALAVFSIVGAVVRRAGKFIFRIASRGEKFFNEWDGEPGTADKPAQPGVLARLFKIESEQKRVRQEVEHNGGGSLKDAVVRTEDIARQTRESQERDHEVIRSMAIMATKEQAARMEGHREGRALWAAVSDISKDGDKQAKDKQA